MMHKTMVFSLAEFVCHEMKARGWTTDDVGERMKGGSLEEDIVSVCLLISLSQCTDQVTVDDKTFKGLARAFDVSESMFRNIHQGWLDHKDCRQAFEPGDEMFGPKARWIADRGLAGLVSR